MRLELEMPLTLLSVGYPLAPVSPGTAGGAEQILLTLDGALVRHGHRSLIVAPKHSECAGLLFPVQIPSGEFDENTRREARHEFRKTIAYVLGKFEVDIIHMHGLDFHEYLPRTQIPIVVTLHLPLPWYSPSAFFPSRTSAHLICVSHSQAKTAPAGVYIDAVIGNGIDLQNYRLAHAKGNYALIMGRICPEKGIHLALDAAGIAGLPVVIAGSVFPYREHEAYFEGQIQSRLSANVRFVGSVGRDRKSDLLAGAKCLLVGSQAEETSSLVAMEAFASGTPVIAWRSGALSEIVAHGRTGWLVSSVEEMAAAIRRADTIDPLECRREAEQRFCSERMVAEYFSLYRRLRARVALEELQAA